MEGQGGWRRAFQTLRYLIVCVRFSAHCVNTVIESSDEEKHEIQVLWVAPPPESGCVRAAVRQHG